MNLGDAVEVVANWSSFVGMRGKVVQVKPHIMVLLDGETLPLRMGVKELRVVGDALVSLSNDGANLTGP